MTFFCYNEVILGGQVMEDNQLRKILSYYLQGEYQINQGASGMNNLTRFIEQKDKKYVLRVYQNHCNKTLVEVEQAILKSIKGVPVPVVIPTLNGEWIVSVDNHLAVLFAYQEGINLKLERLEQYRNYGEMIGHLSQSLAKLTIEVEGYLPYYELDLAYPNHQISQFCQYPYDEFKHLEEELRIVEAVYDELVNMKPEFEKLPKQLIHGDINASNLLMDEEGMISRILDFEFVTKDLRAMEIAICLSEILYEGKEEIWAKLEAFIEGLNQSLSLSEEEIKLLPSLILLRRLDVVIHFIINYRRHISSEIKRKGDFLANQIKKLVHQKEWLDKYANDLIEYFKRY